MIEELSALYEKLNAEVAEIGKYTADLDIFWDGDANDAYNAKLGEDMLVMAKTVMSIRNTVRTADAVFELYMDNEKNVAGLIRACGRKNKKKA